MAPEILTKRGYDLKADCYSFGVLLFELITGSFPDPKSYLMVCLGFKPNCSQSNCKEGAVS
jgi:serine/threonine protein kinase